jgi:anti-sigma factor RsiW
MRARGGEPPVSEAELHGFVDGGLDRVRRDAVQALLAASPEDAARVEMWRRQNERIRAAFASMKTPSRPLPWSLFYGPGAAGTADRGGPASGASSWRERWSGRLIGLAFAGGVLLTACADYFTNHVGAPDDVMPASGEAAEASGAFAAQTLSALRAFGPPPAMLSLSSKGDGGAPELAAPVLPALPAGRQTLAGVRAMPGEQGQMLCMFYARKDAGTLALCAEKTPGPDETAPRVAGDFPSAAISWRQNGADYVLAGALPEPELRALADGVRAQVEAFDGKE